ncbi:GntR family transcriptional regulator [Brevibacterium samyangense]|uniref:GntR family transcriptional regulator n=1 Tax=Brevibacterium samyangense TaxID=366888 RepID=A0ABP5EIH9_9MICO
MHEAVSGVEGPVVSVPDESRDGAAEPVVSLGDVARPGEGASATLVRLVRRDILAGRLPAGTKLAENGLARRYAVSRIPVRECLKALEAEGLVESKPYAGATVVEPPVDDAEDLFAVRIFLEGAMARRAALRAAAQSESGQPDPEWWGTRAVISRILDDGDALIASGEVEGLAELNSDFHDAIAELSGSVSLAGLLRQIAGKIRWLYALNLVNRGIGAWGEHRDIIAAIDAGQADRAASLVEAHVGKSRDSYFEHVGRVGE